tara:strand:- start:158 stop:388 length:231 start_codon:yes stop_codon:yes gene_type:complete
MNITITHLATMERLRQNALLSPDTWTYEDFKIATQITHILGEYFKKEKSEKIHWTKVRCIETGTESWVESQLADPR